MTCPFCLTQTQPFGYIIFQGETAYILTNPDPVLTNSLMIIPLRHVETPFDLNGEEWLELLILLSKAKAHLDKSDAQGYSIGWNVGEVAGQSVKHLHLHVIGRFADEPLAGKGIRHHLKQIENQRSKIENQNAKIKGR